MPGPRGGYELRRDVHGISVLELIEAVEGPVDVQTCVLRGASCGVGEPCALHGPWSRARDALLGELDVDLLLKAGEDGTVTISGEPGTYELICTVAGHVESGMVGELTIG